MKCLEAQFVISQQRWISGRKGEHSSHVEGRHGSLARGTWEPSAQYDISCAVELHYGNFQASFSLRESIFVVVLDCLAETVLSSLLQSPLL